jgi:hypothetical protein
MADEKDLAKLVSMDVSDEVIKTIQQVEKRLRADGRKLANEGGSD